MNAGGGSVRLELLFAAPVPAGNEILWYRIHQPEAQRGGEILLDRTASTLYCDENVAFLVQDRDAVFDLGLAFIKMVQNSILLIQTWNWQGKGRIFVSADILNRCS